LIAIFVYDHNLIN